MISENDNQSDCQAPQSDCMYHAHTAPLRPLAAHPVLRLHTVASPPRQRHGYVLVRREATQRERRHYMESGSRKLAMKVETDSGRFVLRCYLLFFANPGTAWLTPFTPPFIAWSIGTVHCSYSALVGFGPEESSACSDHDRRVRNDSSTRWRWKKEPFIFATA